MRQAQEYGDAAGSINRDVIADLEKKRVLCSERRSDCNLGFTEFLKRYYCVFKIYCELEVLDIYLGIAFLFYCSRLVPQY